MTTEKKISIIFFFDSDYDYCALVCMFHGRKSNIKLNSLHERCLRLIYKNKRSSYEEILEKYGFDSIHHRNIQVLAAEI